MSTALTPHAETDLWAQARANELRAIRWRWRLALAVAIAAIVGLIVLALRIDALNPLAWFGLKIEWRPFGEDVPLSFDQIFMLILALGLIQAAQRTVRWFYEKQAGAAIVPQIAAMPGAPRAAPEGGAFDIAKLHELGLLPYYQWRNVRHVLAGQHRGVAYHLGELRLMRRTGGKNKRWVDAFRGLLLRIDAPAPNASHVLVEQGQASHMGEWISNVVSALSDAPQPARTPTGDQAFDARFTVTTDLPDLPARYLTPQARAALTQIADSDLGPGMAAIFTGNVLTFAFPARPMLFDPGPLFFGAGSVERRVAMAVDSAHLPRRVIEMWVAAAGERSR